MFPSPNCNNPFESLLKIRSSSSPSPSPSSSSFPYDQNPTPKHDDLLFNFPSPFLDEHESPLNQIFLQNRGKSKIEEIGNPQNQTPSAAPAPARRRRAGKKDRHSKICTAQGIRDRRMRLSLQVARKFFDLQDMLGYDKASKTIEWLFTQSNKAIKDLSSNNADVKSESFLSECEDLSGIEEINSNAATTPKPDAKASRDKARARARCRTREKMLVKRLHFSGDYCFKPNPNYEHPNPYVGEISPYVGMIDKFLGNSISSPSSDYHCAAAASDSNLMGIFGNWDFSSNDRSNCFQYAVANQVTFAANLNSNFSPATAEFP